MSFAHEFMNILNMTAVPSEVMEELKGAPRWRAPIIFSVAATLIVGWFMVPAMEQPLRAIYVRSFGETGATTAVSSAMKLYIVCTTGLQVTLIPVRWSLIAVFMIIFRRVLGKGSAADFRRLFSAVAYAEVVFVAMSVLTVLILYAKGIETIERPVDLIVFRGLDYFLHDQTPSKILPGFLSSINIFSVWYVYLLATGMRIIGGEPGRRALGISAAAWCAWSGLAALLPAAMDTLLRVAAV